MSIKSTRPLATDEVLQFDLPLPAGDAVGGRARVLREQAYGVYALRFEALGESARSRLAGVAAQVRSCAAGNRGAGEGPAEIGPALDADPSNLWGNARGGSDAERGRGSRGGAS